MKVYRTNTPLHALLTLNDPTCVESARTLAQRVLLEKGDDVAHLQSMASRVLARPLGPDEKRVLTAALLRARQQFATSPADAEKLLAVGESERDEEIPAVEHAAWTSLAQVLLNLDETLCKE